MLGQAGEFVAPSEATYWTVPTEENRGLQKSPWFVQGKGLAKYLSGKNLNLGGAIYETQREKSPLGHLDRT